MEVPRISSTHRRGRWSSNQTQSSKPENEGRQVRCGQQTEPFPRRDFVWIVGKKSSIDGEKLLRFLEGQRLKAKPYPMQAVRSLSFVKVGELRQVC
jgi:hypothetical protein